MLWVKAVNIFTDKEDVADYKWEIGVNDKVLAEGLLLEHRRPEGAGVLLKRIAERMIEFEQFKQKELKLK